MPDYRWREAQDLHGRHKVPPCHDASEEVVCVALHPADGHIASSLGLRNIQPDRNVLECRTLQLVDGACVTWPDGIGRNVPALFDVVRDRVDGQVPVGLRLDVHAPGIGIVRLHDALHAVDEIGFFVHVARNVQPHALVQLHVQRRRWPACEELVLVLLRRGTASIPRVP